MKQNKKWIIVLISGGCVLVLAFVFLFIRGLVVGLGDDVTDINNSLQVETDANSILETDITETEEEEATEALESAESSTQKFGEDQWKETFLSYYDGDYEAECAVGDGTIHYRMVVTDAACGSRAYALLKSVDGGNSWDVAERDPFAGQMGGAVDCTFLTEQLGFASLMHNGGDEAVLYITENGGKSYEPVTMEDLEIKLSDGTCYNPYDYPQMPYEEDGKIYVLCGQGLDGDFGGGDESQLALFESEDGGHSFSYVKLQTVEAQG